MSKYYRILPGTEAEKWLQEFALEHAKVMELRYSLLRKLLGNRKKKAITSNRRLIGCTYATQKFPDAVPAGLKFARNPLSDGTRYYVPDTKKKSGREIASRFKALSAPSLGGLCGILKFQSCTIDDRGLRINDPGLIYRVPGKFFICVHDDLQPDKKQVERITDIEWEELEDK